MHVLADHFHKQWKRYLIVLVLCLILAIVFGIIRGNNLLSYCDSFFAGGILSFLLGCFSVVNNLGAFNTFGYARYYIFDKFHKESKKQYVDYVDYCEKKQEIHSKHKFNFLPYFIIAIIFIIIALTLYIIIRNYE